MPFGDSESNTAQCEISIGAVLVVPPPPNIRFALRPARRCVLPVLLAAEWGEVEQRHGVPELLDAAPVDEVTRMVSLPPALPDSPSAGHVQLATGEFVWQEVDLRIAGRGLDFTWTRTYRSGPEPDCPTGSTLTTSAPRRSPAASPSGTGPASADLFRADAGGVHVARGIFAEGRFDTANQFHLRFSGGGEWGFRPGGGPAPGRIALIADRNGNALRFAYDETGRLVGVTDSLGRDIRLGYDSAGRLPRSPTSPAAGCPTATARTARSCR